MKTQNVKNPYFTQTTMQASGSFLFEFIGYPVTLLSSLVFARLLGASNLGLYNIADTTVTFVALLAMFGLNRTPMRFIPELQVISGDAKVTSFIRYTLSRLIPFALAATAVLMLLSSYISDVIFKKPELSTLIFWMAPYVLLLTLEKLSIEILKAFKMAAVAMLIRAFIEKASRLGLFVILSVLWKPSLVALIAATFVMYLVGVGVSLSKIGFSFIKAKKDVPLETQEQRKIVKFSGFMFLMGLSNFCSIQVNALILGAYAGSSAVGIYRIAGRLATIIALPLRAVNNIFPANISELHVQKDIEALGMLYRRFTWMILFLSLIPFWFFAIYSRDVLMVFGRDFATGGRALQIMAISHLVNVGVGSAGYILAMTGNEKWEFFNQAVLAIVNVTLAIPLAKGFGILGIVIATAISIVVTNLMRLIEVRLIYGISPYDKTYAKLVVSGGITFGILKGLSYILPSNLFIRIAVAGIAAVASMVGVTTLVCGLDEMEKQLAQEVIERIKGQISWTS